MYSWTVQALRFLTGCTAHRGISCIAILFLDHGTRSWWGISVTPRPHFTPTKDTVSFVQEAGWAPGPVWTGAEYLVPTEIRSPDRPFRSQSLYRLHHPAHTPCEGLWKTYCTDMHSCNVFVKSRAFSSNLKVCMYICSCIYIQNNCCCFGCYNFAFFRKYVGRSIIYLPE